MRKKSPPVCFCGRSKKLPYCDGSHRAEGWTCERPAPRHLLAIAAGPRFDSLARKLASHFGAALVSLRQRPNNAEIDRLVVLVDAAEVIDDGTLTLPHADHTLLVGTGDSGAALRALDPGAQSVVLPRSQPAAFYAETRTAIEEWIRGELAAAGGPRSLRRLFVSHAVHDEPLIVPVVSALRERLGADIFLCADSIPPGSAWHSAIDTALRGTDALVFIVSAESVKSTFCAFEVGYAIALDLPLFLISLDGTLPPAYAQHLQSVDIPRLVHTYPWLEPEDVLLEGLLGALSDEPR